MSDEVAIDLPARVEYLNAVRSLLTAFAESTTDLPPSRVDDLCLAVTEAYVNAIDASRKHSEFGELSIRMCCHREGNAVIVEVTDHAGGFDPAAQTPPPDPTAPDRLQFERGLGIPLMRAVANVLEFESTADGSLVRLVLMPQRP